MGTAERRQRERESRRSLIVDAAEEVFLTKGVDAATMDEVARAAELSKGSLYLHFAGKDELYLAIAIRTLSKVSERAAAAAAEGQTGFERLERMMRAQAEYAVNNPRRFLVSTSWLTTSYVVKSDGESFEEYRKLVGGLFGLGVAAIIEGQRDGSVRAHFDPSVLTVQLWGGLLGTLLVQLRSDEMARRLPGPVNLSGLATGCIALLLQGVGTDPGELASSIDQRTA